MGQETPLNYNKTITMIELTSRKHGNTAKFNSNNYKTNYKYTSIKKNKTRPA